MVWEDAVFASVPDEEGAGLGGGRFYEVVLSVSVSMNMGSVSMIA